MPIIPERLGRSTMQGQPMQSAPTNEGAEEIPNAPNLDLWIARGATLGPVALAFPVAAAAVFALGANRNATADLLAVVYSFGLFLGFTTSLWPLPGLRQWTRHERIQSLCLLFLIVSCITHLSWELVWLIAHGEIAASRDAAWAYPWWAYIDGGDMRYAKATPTLLMMEVLSVVNGLVCAVGLVLWYRSRGRDRSQCDCKDSDSLARFGHGSFLRLRGCNVR